MERDHMKLDSDRSVSRRYLFPIVMLIMAFALISFMAPNGAAAVTTWDGDTNDDWNQGANWDNGVPSSTDNAVIPSGTPNSPEITTSGQCNNLYILSGATLTVNGGYLNTTGQIRLNASAATLAIDNDLNEINAGSIYNLGTIDCGVTNTPEIYLTGSFSNYWNWLAGNSEVHFVGGTTTTLYMSGDPFYDMFMNNENLVLIPGDTVPLEIDNILWLQDGKLDLSGGEVTVNTLRAYGEIEMTDPDDVLMVTTHAHFQAWCDVWGTDGTLVIQDDFTAYGNSKYEFWGDHLALFNGTGYAVHQNYNSDSFFNNVTIDKDSLRWASFAQNLQVNDTFLVEEETARLGAYGTVDIYDLEILNGGDLEVYNHAEVTVQNELYVGVGGTLKNGYSGAGGNIDVGDQIKIYGDVIFDSTAGNISVYDHIYVYSGSNVTFDGSGNLTGNLDSSYVYLYGDIYINSDITLFQFRTLFFYLGELWVENGTSPTIRVGRDFRQGSTGTFNCGQSTMLFSDESITMFEETFTYWGMVIDKGTNYAIPEPSGATECVVQGFLVILSGELALNDNHIEVDVQDNYMHDGTYYTGFANIGGELTMDSTVDILDVNGPVLWGPDSTADVTAGAIYCKETWIFQTGSAVNLTGTSNVTINPPGLDYGEICTNSTASSFNDLNLVGGLGALELDSTQPMVVDGDLVVEIYLGGFDVQDSSLVVWGDLNVSRGNLHLSSAGDVDIHGNAWTELDPSVMFTSNGTISLGENATDGGGTFDIDGWLAIDGSVYYYGYGGDLTVGGHLYVNSGNSLEFRGTAGNLTAANIRVNSSGLVKFFSNDTYVNTHDLIFVGRIKVDADARPTLNMTGDFDMIGGGTFIAGKSELRFKGSGLQSIEDNFNLWGLVIDKTSSAAEPEGDLTVDCYIAVVDGDLDVHTYTWTVTGLGSTSDGYRRGAGYKRGLVFEGGNLVMDQSTGVLDINNNIEWYMGSTEDVTTGNIYLTGSWYFWGSTTGITLGGDNVVTFDGSGDAYLYSWTTTCHFNDLTIDRSNDIYTGGTGYVMVDGDLYMDNTDSDDDLTVDMAFIVNGSVGVNRGSLELFSGSDMDVKGDLETISSNGQLRMSGGDLRVDNDLIADGWGIDIFTNGGTIDVGNDLFVVSNYPGLYIHQDEGKQVTISADLIRINNTGLMRVNSNDTLVESNTNLYIHGTLDVGDYTPKFTLRYTVFGGGTFNYGKSSVWFEGGLTISQNSFEFWNLVINKTGGDFRLGSSTIVVHSCLFILQGNMDMYGYDITVNSEGNTFTYDSTDYHGFVNYGGSLEMTGSAEVLNVNGPVSWLNGSTGTITDGTINCNGSWEFGEGSDVNLTGANVVKFTGNAADVWSDYVMITSDSAESSFHDLTTDRDSGKAVVVWDDSDQPLVVDGNLTLDSGDFRIYSSEVEVGGKVHVNSPILYVDGYGDTTRTALEAAGDMYIQSGSGFMTLASSTSATYVECDELYLNGSMDLGDNTEFYTTRGRIYGSLTYSSGADETASLESSSMLYIYNGATVDMVTPGETWLNSSTNSIWSQAGGELDMRSDTANVYAHLQFYAYMDVYCGPDHTPHFYIGSGFYGGGFRPGHSVVTFTDVSISSIHYDTQFYDIVLDQGPQLFRPEVELEAHDINVTSGTFDLNEHNVTLNGSLDILGELMLVDDVTLEAEGDIKWWPGATEDVTAGTIIANTDLAVHDGAEVSLSGTNLLRFQGSGRANWTNYDKDTTFNDVNVERSGWLYNKGLYAVDDLVVNGDLTIDMVLDYYGLTVNFGTVIVNGDANLVSGKAQSSSGGNITVLGTTYCQDGSYMVAINDFSLQRLEVEGHLLFNSTGAYVHVNESLYVPGSLIDFNAANALLVVDGFMYVNASAVVDMSGSEKYKLIVKDDLFIYGLLNMTNDDAILEAWEDIRIYPSGTLDCGDTSEASIYVQGHFNDVSAVQTQRYIYGHSTVFMNGDATQFLEDSLDYWKVVINKTSGIATLEGTAHDPTVWCAFFIQEGEFQLGDHEMTCEALNLGHEHLGDDYQSFANFGGKLTMLYENSVLDVNKNAFWGPTSDANIDTGTIEVAGNWEVALGSSATLEGDNLVVFDDTNVTDIEIDEPDFYFNNVTFKKPSSSYDTWLLGSADVNVTDTVILWDDNIVDVRHKTLEADMVYLYDDSNLTVSFGAGELYVWNTIDTNSSSTLHMADGSFASVRNLTGDGDVWMDGDSNLTVHQDLFLSSPGEIHSGTSTIYLTGDDLCALRNYGTFHHLVIDKQASVSANGDMVFTGDLRMLDGTFYPQNFEIHIAGDWFCDPGFNFWAAANNLVTFYSGGDQYVQTGGAGGDHEFSYLTISTPGTNVIFQNYSAEIAKNLTVDTGCTFNYSYPGGDLIFGAGGVLINGTFEIYNDGDAIHVVFDDGSTVVNNGQMTLISTDINGIYLQSDNPGTQWHLEDNTASAKNPLVEKIKVEDSDASTGNTIYADGDSTNAGNNDNWNFGKAIDITLDGLEGTTVNISVVQYGTTETIPSFDILGTSYIDTWADEGTTATLEDTFIVTMNEERYYTEDTVSWTMSANLSTSVTYYRQWKPDITLTGTESGYEVTAYYTALGGSSSQAGRHTSWTKWIDNGTSLSFDAETTGSPSRHTTEDFTSPPWDPLTSALTETVTYEVNELPELNDGDVTPDTGDTDTMFNFTVNYTDANGDWPSYVYVNINGVNHSMSETDTGDTDVTDWKEYYYETKLSAGNNDYYFIANDTYEENSTESATQSVTVIPEFLLPLAAVGMMAVFIVIRRRRRN